MFNLSGKSLLAGLLVSGFGFLSAMPEAKACDPRRIAKWVWELQNCPDHDDREEAAEDLGKNADPSVLPVLQHAVTCDRCPDVRREAARAIQRIHARFNMCQPTCRRQPLVYGPSPRVVVQPQYDPRMQPPVDQPQFDPRMQPPVNQPQYDPRMQPPVNQPQYDPRMQPPVNQPQYDPRMQPPFDPRSQPQNQPQYDPRSQPQPPVDPNAPQYDPRAQPPVDPNPQYDPRGEPAKGSSSGATVRAAANGYQYRWDSATRTWTLIRK